MQLTLCKYTGSAEKELTLEIHGKGIRALNYRDFSHITSAPINIPFFLTNRQPQKITTEEIIKEYKETHTTTAVKITKETDPGEA